jgi:LysR family glycine cleavage system transcriptional activator
MTRRTLPSLNALRAFEAFSRHGKMSAAADELCVTHGAVSRQVKQLEEALGARLIEGPKSRLRMTAEGLRLAGVLTGALDDIAQAVAVARAEAPQALEVSCIGTLAMRWLIPRLPRFVEQHPNIRVGLTESHADVDFKRDRIDLAIRMSQSLRAPDAEKTVFLDHHIGPIVAPSLVGPEPLTVERLARLPRLHTRTYRQGWSEWQALSGHRLEPAPVDREFDHHFYMLEAAAAGLGVALGPWPFVMEQVLDGRLVAPLGFITAEAQYVVLRPAGVDNAAAAAFRDWLVDEGAAMPRPEALTPRRAPAP